MSIMLFSYITSYKVAIEYTPYQLVYGLHPLMPTKYIMQVASGNEGNSTSMKVLTTKITELEKLEARMQATKITRIQQWNITLWSQQKIQKKSSISVIMFYGF